MTLPLRAIVAAFLCLPLLAAEAIAGSEVALLADRIEHSDGISFATGSSELLASSFPVLDQIALLMIRNRALSIEVQVHSDSRGSDEYNLRLSQDRARAIFEYLLQVGVPRGRLSFQGYGETCPIDSNQTEAGRARNRRVLFWRLDSNLPRPCPVPPSP